MNRTAGGCALHKLNARFFDLWKRCSSDQDRAESRVVWATLTESYNEPWRHYHTAEHLCHCMQQLDLVWSLLEDPAAVELALWFHDIVLQPDGTDNEQKSADRFQRAAGQHFPADFIENVIGLILATVHDKAPRQQDARYLCDIDLSSLGSPWKQFLTDSTAVRTELSATSDEMFYAAKVRFFNALLDRPTIFFTDFFQSRYERSARNNIQRYIVQIEADGHA